MKQIIILLLCTIHFIFSGQAQHFAEVGEALNLPATVALGGHGNAVSFCDFNGDGWDDITIATGPGTPLLFYENTNGSFNLIDLSIEETADCKQVLWLDYDNDGDKDLLVSNKSTPNHLYENMGNLTFNNITEIVNLPVNQDVNYGVSAGDFNNDGWLDLYYSNRTSDGLNHLFINQGNGSFTDITNSDIGGGTKLSFCSVIFDYNQDGFQDIYVANDRSLGNVLIQNNGNGSYEDVSLASGTNVELDAMNASVGDYDGDGDLDIYVTNSPSGNVLLRNNLDGTFTDVADETGTAFYRIGWGANFLDCDNDADLDLYVSCHQPTFETPNALYINDGFGTFSEPYFETGGLDAKDTLQSFANALGDFNNDGFMDIVVSGNMENSFMLWENQGQPDNNWIKIELEGTVSNRDGIGSWIEVHAGGKKQVCYTHCGEAYLGQNSSSKIVGVGNETTIDSVVVRWLSGIVNKTYNVAANQKLTLIENEENVVLSLHVPSLTAEWLYDNTAAIKWQLQNPEQWKSLELQKSLDGQDFLEIYTTSDWQLENEEKGFSFLDTDITEGQTLFYRLKWQTQDAQIHYSEIVALEPMLRSFSTTIIPNPVTDKVFAIQVSIDKQQTLNWQIIAPDGRLLTSGDYQTQAGINTFYPLIDNKLNKGVYYIRLRSEDYNEVLPFVAF